MSLKRISIFVIVLASLVVSAVGPTATSAAVPILQPASTNAPILLIVNSAAPNKFGPYLGEILRAEGLNAFDQVELNTLTAAQLAQYDLAFLAQTPLSGAQASLFSTYVAGGGALLAMRPDAQLNSLFGLNASAGTLTNGYLQIQTSAVFNTAAPGSGLTAATLQIHGDADQYTTTAGAVMLAQLYSTATSSTPYPAVVAANAGTGQAVAFTYDLASNVAYTRQGNPANANLDVDGDTFIRTIDLFQTVGNPSAPWIDRNKLPIPQADEQQRLLARLVTQLVGRNRPLPQLWYFPGTAKTMLILTADAHWDTGSQYSNLITDVNNHQGKITVYLADRLMLGGSTDEWPSNTDLHSWVAQGHTFAIHPYGMPEESTLATGFNDVDSWFANTYTVPRSSTVRNHRIAWQGWTEAADIEAAHDLGMDFSYYHWGPWLQKPDGTWPHGYLTGSGLPMKFVRPDGTLTAVYQQLTEMADDHLFTNQGGHEGLTGAQAVALSQSAIDASQAGYYSTLTDIHHVDNYGDANYPELTTWLAGDIDYAHSQGVPVWNADQWLSFTQTRHDAKINNLAWNAGSGVLSFSLAMTATAGLTPTTMLPLSYGGKPLAAVTLDGVTYPFTVQTIKSTSVAFVSLPAGNHSVTATYGAGKLSQTITFNPLPDKTYSDPPFTVTATATSGLTVTFTVGSSACSISGATVSLVSQGICPVTAHQSGNTTYNPAPDVTQSFRITQATPVITWSNPANIVYGTALGPTQLNAQASVPGTFVYSPVLGTVLNAGTGQILHTDFTPTDTANYDTAAKDVTITVTKASPTVVVTGGMFTYDGQPHAASGAAHGVGGVTDVLSPALTFTYNGLGAAPATAGTYSVVGRFAGNSNYISATNTAALTITKATVVITWSTPSNIVYGIPLGPTQLNAQASVPGTFVYSPAPGTVLNAVPNQTLHMDFTPTDTTNYGTAAKDVTITVTKASPTVVVTGGMFTYDGQPHAASGTAHGVGGVTDVLSPALTFTYNGSGAAPVAAGTYSVVGRFAGNSNYISATNTAALTITQATPVITWSNPANIVYGTALGPTQLNVQASVPGTFVYSPALGTVLNAGTNQILHMDFTPTDTANYNPAAKDVTITVTKASPTVVVTGGMFTYDGQPHAASGVAHGVDGVTDVLSPALTFTCNGSGAAPVAAGTYSVVGRFAGNSNYISATNTAALTITQATPVITWSNPADIGYGTALGPTQLNAQASVPGTFVYSPVLGTVLNAGPNQILHMDFTPTDTANYNPAAKDVVLNVQMANQTINFAALPDTVYGSASFTVTASASSGSVVTFTVSGMCNITGTTVTVTGAGSCAVTAHRAGDANFNAAPDVAHTFTIVKADQTITFDPLPKRMISDSPFTVSAYASAGLPITFTASGECSVAGPTVTLTGAGSCTVTAHQAGDANFKAAPDVAHTFTIKAFQLYLPLIMNNKN